VAEADQRGRGPAQQQYELVGAAYGVVAVDPDIEREHPHYGGHREQSRPYAYMACFGSHSGLLSGIMEYAMLINMRRDVKRESAEGTSQGVEIGGQLVG
jgi:hypothetical protein